MRTPIVSIMGADALLCIPFLLQGSDHLDTVRNYRNKGERACPTIQIKTPIRGMVTLLIARLRWDHMANPRALMARLRWDRTANPKPPMAIALLYNGLPADTPTSSPAMATPCTHDNIPPVTGD